MRRCSGLLCALLACAAAAAVPPQKAGSPRARALAPAAPKLNEPADFVRSPPAPATITGRFSLVSIGDLLYSYPMADRKDPALQKVIRIISSGDVTIANREGALLDPKERPAGYGDGLLWSDAALARDERSMGIDMVSLANNHGMDWGKFGLFETERLHRQAGIVTAGGGRSLSEARAPGLLKTPHGTVALLSTTASFKANARADDALGRTGDRAGISTLRTRTVQLLPPEDFALVRRLAADLASPLEPAPAADATEIDFNGQLYRLSGERKLLYQMDLFDHAGILKSIRDAKAKADLVVFTIHAHQSPTGDDDDAPAPPNFLIRLFHDAVDAGADVIMGGGPHSMRGIEIYKGKPIFYGLGAFFINGDIEMLQESAQKVFPDKTGHAPPPPPPSRSVRAGGNPASWYDGVIAVSDFDGGTTKRVRLYPLDLGNTYDRSRRGIPHLASPEDARRILANLQRYSAPFGTRISVEGSVGVIDIR